MGWVPGPLFVLSIAIFAYWINWVGQGREADGVEDLDHDHVGNEWNTDVRNKYAIQIGCEPNFAEYPECENLYDASTKEWRPPRASPMQLGSPP